MKRILSTTVLLISLLLLAEISSAAESWTVIDAVRGAVSSHPAVNIAESIPQEAKGNRLSALSLPSPAVAFEYEGIPTNSGLSGYEGRRLSFTQEMEFPLRYAWLISRENASVNIANQQMKKIILDLEADVRRVYTDAWRLSEQVGVMEKYSAMLETHSVQTQRLSELGELSLLEARRAKVEALQAVKTLESVRRDKVAAFDRLARLAGVDSISPDIESPLNIKRVESNLDELSNSNPLGSISAFDREGKPTTSLPFAHNPDYRAAELNKVLSGYEKKLVVAGWIPELELSYFREGTQVDADPDYWGAEIGLSIPLWFWWGGKGEIQATKARDRRANAERAAMLIDLGSDWESWTQEFQTAYEHFNLYQFELVPLGLESFELAQKSYSLGEIGYLEVIDAQRTHLDVQLEYFEAASNLYISEVEMDRLSGHSIINGVEELE